MTEFRYPRIRLKITENKWMRFIPEEWVIVGAYHKWENARKPEGRSEEFYFKTEKEFLGEGGVVIIPTKDYLMLEGIMQKDI